MLTYLVHAKSSDEFRLTFDSMIAQSGVWYQLTAENKLLTERSLSPNKKITSLFWPIVGLSPDLGLSDSLSERLSQKVK